MGFFKDIDQLKEYEAQYCGRCLHYGGHDALPPHGVNLCPVYQAHAEVITNGQPWKTPLVLHRIIPEKRDGSDGNEQCRMFVDVFPPAPVEGYGGSDVLGYHSHNVGAPRQVGGPDPGTQPCLPTGGYWRHVHDEGDVPHRHDIEDVFDSEHSGGDQRHRHEGTTVFFDGAIDSVTITVNLTVEDC